MSVMYKKNITTTRTMFMKKQDGCFGISKPSIDRTSARINKRINIMVNILNHLVITKLKDYHHQFN